ncbi:hypothetical protein F2Q68_00003445 [Brassica cretica]|uniref:Secreted protein n=1 Tax=Brassica cretica TaxID=69181 RepID=A0A8S9JIS8_BRACR|nr:hypothetical protein F2Q68_00003445 [Brassica cretica]KAF3511578.1 hypothetical protein F2Q69_00004828 [Brassica cretica]
MVLFVVALLLQTRPLNHLEECRHLGLVCSLVFYNPWFSLPSRTSAIRTDVRYLEERICRTTVQERYLISDDDGQQLSLQ